MEKRRTSQGTLVLQCGISKDQLVVRKFVQNRERLKELFCEVDLAIMPSRTEGFGLTALEALSVCWSSYPCEWKLGFWRHSVFVTVRLAICGGDGGPLSMGQGYRSCPSERPCRAAAGDSKTASKLRRYFQLGETV